MDGAQHDFMSVLTLTFHFELMCRCVQNGNYGEALDLEAFVAKLSTMHSRLSTYAPSSICMHYFLFGVDLHSFAFYSIWITDFQWLGPWRLMWDKLPSHYLLRSCNVCDQTFRSNLNFRSEIFFHKKPQRRCGLSAICLLHTITKLIGFMLSPTIVLLLVYYSECCVLILQLPKCLRVVGYLRRLATFNEQIFAYRYNLHLLVLLIMVWISVWLGSTSITSWEINNGSCLICCSY